MKICPVAIAVGCRRCPVFKLCLVKGLIGDYQAPAPSETVARAARTATTRTAAAKSPKAGKAAKKPAARKRR